ncbi:MAG: hypothetical protein HUU15_04270 [Candidatus Brocadiae bacterium]|nr:hypothetical protein [Candidatus Brocadiia bacterium]
MSRDVTRYANRKMYDSRTRSYITLATVLKLILKGESVRVVAHGSGVDLTGAVILQAMLDVEKKRPGSWSAAALAGLARRRRGPTSGAR